MHARKRQAQRAGGGNDIRLHVGMKVEAKWMGCAAYYKAQIESDNGNGNFL